MLTTRGRIDWAHLFFSSHGRLARAPFAAAIAVVFAMFATYDLGASGPARDLTGWAVFTLLFFSACCLLAKRLHDRNRSGWWTAVVMAAFASAWPEVEGLTGLAGAAVLLIAGVDLLLIPGWREANRFGPPPGAVVR